MASIIYEFLSECEDALKGGEMEESYVPFLSLRGTILAFCEAVGKEKHRTEIGESNGILL